MLAARSVFHLARRKRMIIDMQHDDDSRRISKRYFERSIRSGSNTWQGKMVQ